MHIIILYISASTKYISGTCDGTYDASKNEIRSPNFPEPYENNKLCTWRILAPVGKVIELQFREFDVENSTLCVKDQLNVYDGKKYKRIATLCGSTVPEKIMSLGHTLKLKFLTNIRKNRNGFRIKFKIKG